MSAGVKGVNNGTGNNGIGVYGVHAGSGYGVYGSSNAGTGVYGTSPGGFALKGETTSGTGVYTTSNSGEALHAESFSNTAGYFGVNSTDNGSDAVHASNGGAGTGVNAYSESGIGMFATTNTGSWGIVGLHLSGGTAIYGVTQSSSNASVEGENDDVGPGVRGINYANGGTAVQGELSGVSSGNVALFKVNGANVARIDQAGKAYFNGGSQTGGADVAEYFDVEGQKNEYEPGDVLIISQSSDRKVEKSQQAYSTLVAGVYATKPGLLLTEKNAVENQLQDMVPMGVIGVIPTKVCLEGGAIKRGDLLVTSSVPGVAMKADLDKVRVGQVIGKALADYTGDGIGKILVLVSIK
jgi:hypothetical protein